MQDEIRVSQRALGSGDAFVLHRVCSTRAQPGRIRKAERDPAHIDYFLDRIAGRAGYVADDGAGKTEQAIEQARFPGVGRAINHDPHAFSKDSTLVGGGEQCFDFQPDCVQPREEGGTDIRLDVFIREVDISLEVGDERNQIFAQLGNFLAQPAFELFRRRAKRQIGLGPNQVDDRFGLRQVEFAIEKSALGEFTRTR